MYSTTKVASDSHSLFGAEGESLSVRRQRILIPLCWRNRHTRGSPFGRCLFPRRESQLPLVPHVVTRMSGDKRRFLCFLAGGQALPWHNRYERCRLQLRVDSGVGRFLGLEAVDRAMYWTVSQPDIDSCRGVILHAVEFERSRFACFYAQLSQTTEDQEGPDHL